MSINIWDDASCLCSGASCQSCVHSSAERIFTAEFVFISFLNGFLRRRTWGTPMDSIILWGFFICLFVYLFHQHSFIHFQSEVYPAQGHRGSGFFPENAGYEERIHPGAQTGPSQGKTQTHSYFILPSPPTSMFLRFGRKPENLDETHRWKPRVPQYSVNKRKTKGVLVPLFLIRILIGPHKSMLIGRSRAPVSIWFAMCSALKHHQLVSWCVPS